FQNDYAAAYDTRQRAVLQFLPASARSSPHDYGPVNPVLRDPPRGARKLRRAVRRVVDGLSEPGVYIAFGARRRDAGYQVGFDAAPMCAHQSELAERTIATFDPPPDFLPFARGLFVCSATVLAPGGPLGACRTKEGWRYQARSAYDDSRSGTLGRSPIAACQANAAVARRLRFRKGAATAGFGVAVPRTRAPA